MDWRQRSAKDWEVFAEGGVALVFCGEDFVDAVGELGDFGGELGDGILPVGDVGLLVVEEELEDFDELFRRGDGLVEGDAAVLVEDGVVGRLEEGVDERVALFALFADFDGELVVGVLGFPDAVLEGEFVDECAVGTERLFGGAFEVEFLDEVPVVWTRSIS